MAEIQPKDTGGGGGKKRAKKGSTKVDMTPLVDLGFLLLTFFVMTTTLAKPQIMEINMPVKPKNEIDQPNEIKASNAFTILLGGDDRIYYYRGLHQPAQGAIPELIPTDWSSKGIRRALVEAKSNPDLVVLIKADETSSYKNLVDILDEMSITGTQKYAIVKLDNADAGLLRKAEGGE